MRASLAGLLALGGCVARCPAGLARMEGVRLYFGGSLPTRDWEDFAAATLTQAYPDGFTTTDATGQWRNPVDRALVRERTRVVEVFGTDALARSASVLAAYKQRFHEQTVGVVRVRACAGF